MEQDACKRAGTHARLLVRISTFVCTWAQPRLSRIWPGLQGSVCSWRTRYMVCNIVSAKISKMTKGENDPAQYS